MLNKKNIVIADTHLSRLRGLYFRKNKNIELVLHPCNDIHTAFFRSSIDVAFLDKNGLVLMSKRNLRPWKRVKYKSAKSVVERFSNKTYWYRVGDTLGCIRGKKFREV